MTGLWGANTDELIELGLVMERRGATCSTPASDSGSTPALLRATLPAT